MNEHLGIVFNQFLPELEKTGIDYWVYGGVSVAGVVGRFYRHNKDVDVFVKNEDFGNACSVLGSACQNQAMKCHTAGSNTERPKFEILDSNENEIFSIIPVFQEGQCIIFKYPSKYGGDQIFPVDFLEREERNVSDCIFFTTQTKYVKELFIKHMKTRPHKRLMTRPHTFRKDAEFLLSLLEKKEIEDFYSSNG